MKIFFENNKDKIRFQLKDLKNDTMLFDFAIDNEDYYSLVNHMDDNLKDFEKNNEKNLRLSKKGT